VGLDRGVRRRAAIALPGEREGRRRVVAPGGAPTPARPVRPGRKRVLLGTRRAVVRVPAAVRARPAAAPEVVRGRDGRRRPPPVVRPGRSGPRRAGARQAPAGSGPETGSRPAARVIARRTARRSALPGRGATGRAQVQRAPAPVPRLVDESSASESGTGSPSGVPGRAGRVRTRKAGQVSLADPVPQGVRPRRVVHPRRDVPRRRAVRRRAAVLGRPGRGRAGRGRRAAVRRPTRRGGRGGPAPRPGLDVRTERRVGRGPVTGRPSHGVRGRSAVRRRTAARVARGGPGRSAPIGRSGRTGRSAPIVPRGRTGRSGPRVRRIRRRGSAGSAVRSGRGRCGPWSPRT